MKSFFTIIVILLISNTTGYGQTLSVNDFKYVLVPQKYGWANEVDLFQINSLTTFLFKKYGFDAYTLGDSLPVDLNGNGCNTLTADVQEDSGLLRTKLKVILKDCKGDIVFASQEGVSKLKEYKQAYHEALRDAFYSIGALEYAYNKQQEITQVTTKVQEAKATPGKGTQVAEGKKEEMQSIQDKPEAQITDAVTKDTAGITLKTEIPHSPENAVANYRSLDGSYHMEVDAGKIVFYEGNEVIGVMVTKATTFYDIETNEFSGKGYFLDNQFIVNRKIKGLQGTVQMIFEKQ